MVQPCIDELNRIYCASETACFDQLSAHQIKNIGEISNHTIIKFINNIYAHFDAFRLLYSDGTSYHDFAEKLVLLEVKESLRFFEELKNRGFTISDIPENVIHMLTHCYFYRFLNVLYIPIQRKKL